MPLPRVQFTVRRMMVAAAIAGIVMGLAKWMERRSAHFADLSRSHCERIVGILSGPIDQYGEHPEGLVAFDLELNPVRGVQGRRDIWHFAMAQKYREAARRPWLPVAPDPPEPSR